MGDFHKYEALEGSVKMEDITNNEINAEILRWLSDNDSDFTAMWLQQDPQDESDFRPTTAKEMGWLGYFVGKSTQLQTLNVIHSSLGEWSGTIEPFCNGLSRNKSIKRIEFESMDLSRGDIFGIMQPFFENNPSLIDLNIQRCNNFGIEGCRLLSFALGSCASKCLQHVSLAYDGLGDSQLVDIIVALSMHPSLKSLDLSGNQLGRNACMALATLVQWSAPELSELNLGDNAIGDEGIELLVPALSNNTSLKVLFLSSNGISSKGIQALSSVLQSSSSSNLDELRLHGNQFGDNGAKILASSLANNVSLKSLGLFGTNITDEGWKPFANLLCDSSSVNKTHLSNHTLNSILLGASRYHSSVFTLDVTPLLKYNEEGDKKKVAVKKIITTHKDISMQPFFEWDLKVLPIAVKLFDNAISMAGIAIEQRKLSVIYQFIRGMPLLYIEGCLKRELSELQHEDMFVQQEKMMLEAKLRALMKREEGIQARKNACMDRLSGH